MQDMVLSIFKVSEHDNQPELEHELLPQYVINTGEHDGNVCFFRNDILQYETAIRQSSAEERGRIGTVGCCVLTPSRLTTPHFAFFRQPPTILGHYSCQKPSIIAADPRRIVGSMVEAKACHVTNLVECSRHYVSNSKTKRLRTGSSAEDLLLIAVSY